MPVPESSLDRLERDVVIRLSRAFFLLAAGGASLAVVVGLVALVFSVVRPPIFRPAPPPPVAEEPPVALSDAQKLAATRQGVPTSGRPLPRELTQVDLSAIEGAFPAPEYVWDDVTQQVCTRQTSFGCLHMSTEVQRPGVVHAFSWAVWRVPESAREDATQVMARLVGSAPLQGRDALLLPLAELYVQRRQTHQQKLDERQARVDRDLATYEGRVAARQVSELAFRAFGLSAALGGLAALIVIGLVLAQLATERHLRQLERLVRVSAGGSPTEREAA